MIHDITTAAAREHQLDLSREAASARLARLAACCRPSYLRERFTELIHWLRGGQLGEGYVNTPSGPITARCCSA